MAEPAGDVDVDVLVVGDGVVGHYLATQLADRYTVCLLSDPDTPDESLASDGLVSGGYDGNDVGRIQPARRAAGYWHLWAEANAVSPDTAPSLLLVDPDREVAQVRFWMDAALHVERLGLVPAAFRGGTVGGHVAFRAVDDVALDPASMVRTLRSGIERCCVDGRVVDVTLDGDGAVEAVDAEIDGLVVSIVARYTVFAADAANADLLAKVAARTRDGATRRGRAEIARTCQAVRKQLQVLIRGTDLPLVTAGFEGLRVVAHQVSATDVVWVVTPPIDDRRTTLGPEDLRFAPQVDRTEVAAAVEQLLEASPMLAEQALDQSWSATTRRKTEHPMMAGDVAQVGTPSPAKIETMDMDSFAAVWPGHLAYAMIVGDVIAEKVVAALGRGAGFDPAAVSALSSPGLTLGIQSHFGADDVAWRTWEDFRMTFLSR